MIDDKTLYVRIPLYRTGEDGWVDALYGHKINEDGTVEEIKSPYKIRALDKEKGIVEVVPNI